MPPSAFVLLIAMYYSLTTSFSRFLLWLELAPTNCQPEQICAHFLNAVEEYGLPHNLRVDAGSENTHIKWAQMFFTQNLPRLTALAPVLVGSSNHNEVKLISTRNTYTLTQKYSLHSVPCPMSAVNLVMTATLYPYYIIMP